jgi:hypothetical protein
MSKMTLTKADFAAVIKAADKLGNNDGVADVSEIQEVRSSGVRKGGWFSKSIATRLRGKITEPELKALEKFKQQMNGGLNLNPLNPNQIDSGGGATPAFQSILREIASNDSNTDNLSKADIDNPNFTNQLANFNKNRRYW